MVVSKEFIKYCLVGVVNTIAGISTAYICLNVFSLSYLVSTAMAYVVGIIVSFFLNKIYTFKDKTDKCFGMFIKFVFTMLPSYVIAYSIGWFVSKSIFSIPQFNLLCLELFSNHAMSTDKVIGNLAILISMIIYLLLGFAVNKFLVFNQKNKSKVEL